MPDVSNIFGLVARPGASSVAVKYLGNYSRAVDCERAFLAVAQPRWSYTYVTGEYAQPHWRYGCDSREDGVFAPKPDGGAVSGQCRA